MADQFIQKMKDKLYIDHYLYQTAHTQKCWLNMKLQFPSL